VVSRVGFRGYVLEEVLAFLIRNAGYRLLVDPSQGEQLAYGRNGLVVVGRVAGRGRPDDAADPSFAVASTSPTRLPGHSSPCATADSLGLLSATAGLYL
jgi:hypothetical protein